MRKESLEPFPVIDPKATTFTSLLSIAVLQGFAFGIVHPESVLLTTPYSVAEANVALSA
jgi:hypothetical protein